MKRSREEIIDEYVRNIRRKKTAEETLQRLTAEYEKHSDTISEKIPACLKFLVDEGRLTEFEINHTLQNYRYMRVETWICKFTLDKKVWIGMVARTFMDDKEPKWGGMLSLNSQNRPYFELLSRKEAEISEPFGVQKQRNEVFGGVVPTWKWALETQYDNEVRAIILLCHLHYIPTDEEPRCKKETPVPRESVKLEGFEFITIPITFGHSPDDSSDE